MKAIGRDKGEGQKEGKKRISNIPSTPLRIGIDKFLRSFTTFRINSEKTAGQAPPYH
jgi:hypothetical protein